MKKIFLLDLLLILLLFFPGCNKKTLPSVKKNNYDLIKYDRAKYDYLFSEGLRLSMLGNYGDAIGFFQECINLNGNSDASYYNIAKILIGNNDLQNAKRYLKKAISIENKNSWYYNLLSTIYYTENKLDSAIYYYQFVTLNDKDDFHKTMNLGNLYVDNGELLKALNIFESLDNKYGVNEYSTISKIDVLLKLKRYDKALKNAELLCDAFRQNIKYVCLLAEINREMGNVAVAQHIYAKLINEDPENPDIQLSVSNFLLNEKKYSELVGFLNEIASNKKVPIENQVSLFSRILEDEEFLKFSNNNLIITVLILKGTYPDNEIIDLLHIDLLYKLQKYDSAIELAKEVILKTNNYIAWERMLFSYLAKEDYKNLQEQAELCSMLFNRSLIVKMLFASAAIENNDYKTALKELDKAVILAGNDSLKLYQVISTKADVFYKMGENEKAFNLYDSLIKIDNNNLTLLNNYSYYLAENDLKLKEAYNLIKKVISKEPDNAVFLDTYGWVLYKLKRYNKAEKIFEKIFESDENPNATNYEHYAYILLKRKKYSQAMSCFTKAMEMDKSKEYLKDEMDKCKKQ